MAYWQNNEKFRKQSSVPESLADNSAGTGTLFTVKTLIQHHSSCHCVTSMSCLEDLILLCRHEIVNTTVKLFYGEHLIWGLQLIKAEVYMFYRLNYFHREQK